MLVSVCCCVSVLFCLCQKKGEIRKNAGGSDKLLDWDKTGELVNYLAFM